MIPNGRVLRQTAQIVDETTKMLRPVFWPAMTQSEAREEWDGLRCWVEQLWRRFPNLTRIPDCWWRHNDLVEVLAALRDYERGCYGPSASATAAVEWHRSLRDMEIRIEIWIKRFTCNVTGRGHTAVPPDDHAMPDGWSEFVQADVARRPLSARADGSVESRIPDRKPVESTEPMKG